MKPCQATVLLLATLTLFAAGQARAAGPARSYLGAFSNVAISPLSGDCGGVSLQLWKLTDPAGRQKVTGTFFDASGSCPGAAAPIEAADVDPSTGRVHLRAVGTNGVVVAQFKGNIANGHARGSFGYGHQATGVIDGWEVVDLKRLSRREWKRLGGQ